MVVSLGLVSPEVEARMERVNHQYRLVQTAIVLVAVVVMAGLLGALLQIASTNRDNGRTNRANSEAIRANTSRLIDCTTPGHDCYDQANKRTGQVVGSINEVTIAAAFCARTLTPNAPLPKFRACIVRHVKQAQAHSR